MCIYFPPSNSMYEKPTANLHNSTKLCKSVSPVHVVIFRIITLRLNQQKQIKPKKEIKACSV